MNPAHRGEAQRDEIVDTHRHKKSPCRDVGLRFDPESADLLAAGWREHGWRVRVFPRFVKADGVSFPIYLVVAREVRK